MFIVRRSKKCAIFTLNATVPWNQAEVLSICFLKGNVRGGERFGSPMSRRDAALRAVRNQRYCSAVNLNGLGPGFGADPRATISAARWRPPRSVVRNP